MTLTPDWQELKDSVQNVKNGKWLRQNVLSVGFPSMIDPARSDGKYHLMCLHPDFAPLKDRDGQSKWTKDTGRHYVETLIVEMEYYAPGFKDLVADWHLVSSEEMSKEYGLTGKHCFHGDMAWPHVLDARIPVLGAGPETDLENVFLGGSCSAPGGTVTGAPGYRVAHAIMNSTNHLRAPLKTA